MLTERLQILVTADQRRRLEHEARRRGTSVGRVVRDSVDAQLGRRSVEERQAAVERIAALSARFATPEELNRIVEEEREQQLDEIARHIST